MHQFFPNNGRPLPPLPSAPRPLPPLPSTTTPTPLPTPTNLLEATYDTALSAQEALRSTGLLPPRSLPPSRPPPYRPDANLITTTSGIAVPGGGATDTKKLGGHIAQAAHLYKTGDYEKAHASLTDPTLAKANGLSLKVSNPGMDLDDGATIAAQLRSKYMAHSGGKIEMVDPIFYHPTKPGLHNGTTVGQNPGIAKQVLPLQMEEWMHQHQARLARDGINGGFISQLTPAFALAHPKVGNLNEVDILASFHQWGLPVKDLGTIGQYPERETFWAWAKQCGYAK